MQRLTLQQCESAYCLEPGSVAQPQDPSSSCEDAGCKVRAVGERSINLKCFYCPELDTSADICNFKYLIKLWLFEVSIFWMGSWILMGNWRFGPFNCDSYLLTKISHVFREFSAEIPAFFAKLSATESRGLPEIINISLPLPFPVRPDTILVIKFGKMIEVKNGNLATKNTFQLIHLCEKLNAESKVNHSGNSVLKNKKSFLKLFTKTWILLSSWHFIAMFVWSPFTGETTPTGQVIEVLWRSASPIPTPGQMSFPAVWGFRSICGRFKVGLRSVGLVASLVLAWEKI